MIKHIPKPILSEESEFENQMYTWLHDSHYWVHDDKCNLFICKWCGSVMPLMLNNSRLCKENPELLKYMNS